MEMRPEIAQAILVQAYAFGQHLAHRLRLELARTMATSSSSHAMKEFDLELDELRCCPVQKRGSCHGNPFWMLRREDVLRVVENKKSAEPNYNAALDKSHRAKEVRSARAAVAEATKQIQHWTQKKRAAEEALRRLVPVTFQL